MKILKYLSATLFALMMFSACQSDLDKIEYDEAGVTPSTLNALSTATYTLLDKEGENDFDKFSWTKTTFDISVVPNYSIEVDLLDNNFAHKKVLQSTADTEGSFKIKDLNTAIRLILGQTLEDYDAEKVYTKTYQFRIATTISPSAKPIYSNIITAEITTYVPPKGEPVYPKIWVIGDYCGWGHDKSQFLYSQNSNDDYEGWICFDGKADKGWKLTPAANWDSDWGADKVTPPAAEAVSQVLQEKGDNITCYSGYAYFIKFNKSTGAFNIDKKISESFGIIGDVTPGGGWDASINMTFDNTTKMFTLTTTLISGKEFKFRADNKWDINFGKADVDGQLKLNSDKNLKFDGATGTYKITVNLNKVFPVYTVDPAN